jgi:protein TonB
VATGSPIVPTSTPVEPAEEPIPQTTFKAETAAASRLDNRQAEWPSEPNSIRLPVPAQAIQQQSEGLSPALTPSGGPKVTSATRPDYTWLFETILRRMEEVKKYPTEARLNQAQGKVVLKAIIRSDGSVEDVEIAQSSGHQTLDEAAVELLKVAGPFELPRPLEKPQLTVKIPMSYRLQ